MQSKKNTRPQSLTTQRLLTLVGVVLVILALVLFWMQLWQETRLVSDFTQDYLAARSLRDGQSIYRPFTLADMRADELGTREPLHMPYEEFYNYHPPFDAVLFLPLTLLPYDVAMVVWGMLTLLLYLGSWFLAVRVLHIHMPTHWMVLAAGLVLWWYPFQAHMILGQLAILLLACLLGAWLLIQRGNSTMAGVLIGFACLVKLFPALIFLYLLLQRRWQAILSGMMTIAAGALLTLWVVGTDDVLHYFEHMVPQNMEQYRFTINNYSLKGVTSRMFMPGPWTEPLVDMPQLAQFVTSMTSGGVVVLLLLHWRRRQTTTPHGDITLFSLFLVAMLLLSPTTWEHGFLLLVVPMAVLIRTIQTRTQHRYRLLLLSLLATVLVSLPDIDLMRLLVQVYAPHRVTHPAALLFLLPTVGLVLFWVALVVQAPRDTSVDRSDKHMPKRAVTTNEPVRQPAQAKGR